jgi:hypothetical protein
MYFWELYKLFPIIFVLFVNLLKFLEFIVYVDVNPSSNELLENNLLQLVVMSSFWELFLLMQSHVSNIDLISWAMNLY